MTSRAAGATASAAPRLERDLDLLAALFADVVAEQAGPRVAEAVASLHAEAVAWRGGDRAARERLSRFARSLSAEEAADYVRACSMLLQLANVGEEVERVRRHRRYEAEGGVQPESLAEATALLETLPPDEAAALVRSLDARLVLTMHPSDSTRRAVLYKQRAIAGALEALDGREAAGAARSRRLLDEVREALTAWWQTDEVRRLRPDVDEEVRRTIYFFESVLFDVAPDVVGELERGAGVRLERPPLSFGSWAGGDMDGNDGVTPEAIAATLRVHRLAAVSLLRDRVRRLTRVYTHSSGRVALGPELEESLRRDDRELAAAARELGERFRDEPLRRKLYLVWYRLANTLAATRGDTSAEPGYADARELEADLELVRGALGPSNAGRAPIEQLLRQVRIFGFHLARLDVREHAAHVRAAAAALLPALSGAEGERERIRLLAGALAAGDAGRSDAPLAPEAERVLRALAALRHGTTAYGPDAVGAFVVSGTERASEVLAALWLAGRAGLAPFGEAASSVVDVVPLFESGASLRDAGAVMDALYAEPAYRRHLAARDGVQEVMVGYSDSAKDVGFLTGQWLIYRAQEALAGGAAAAGVGLRVFHGRGGSPARGGAPTHAAILARPRATASPSLRLTEQGEVVRVKYSHPDLARRALEQTLSALLVGAAAEAVPEAAWTAQMERLSETARAAYRDLVEDRGFLRFFAEVTPIDLVRELPLGSRPPARRHTLALTDLRAIPWVFSWTQNRVLLPSWYGVGTALAEADVAVAREMWSRWPFFRALLATVETALFKADLGTGELYLRLASDERLAERMWRRLRAEHARTVELLLAITGQSELLEAKPAVKARLPLRNPWVDPLSHLQVELLERYRAGQQEAREPLLATAVGIAAGLRSTG